MCKGLKLGVMGVREIVTPLLTMESIIVRKAGKTMYKPCSLS
jgi:hypothetical protein